MNTCPDNGRLTIAQGHAFECQAHHWVIVADAPHIHAREAPIWLDAILILGLVMAGVAAVALVRLLILDWKSR